MFELLDWRCSGVQALGKGLIRPSAMVRDTGDDTKLAMVKWRRLFPQWSQRFTVVNGEPRSGTWLDSKWKLGMAVGCKCCHAAGLQGRFATYSISSTSALQSEKFQRHQNNPRHKAAVAAYLSGVKYDGFSPSQDAFFTIMDALKAGDASDSSWKSSRGRKIAWCVLEAIKEHDQTAIKRAASVSLFRDERAGRLLIRYRAVATDMTVVSGTLGQARDFGTGAGNITRATEEIMTRLCTLRHNPPTAGTEGVFKSKADQVLNPLLQHLRKSVICLAVDSASDELLSAEMMRSSVLSPSQRILTPNLRFVLRDKAHASRRVVSRPWAADPYIKDVANMFAHGRNSIARMVQNSHAISQIFQDYVASVRNKIVNSACANMRAAKHRFESHARPMGRSCLHLLSCIRTALHISSKSSKDVADRANEWLLWVDNEKCVMAAMLSDASDQALSLTRIMDSEDVDPATIHAEIRSFNLTITALFDQKQCLSVFGYTKVMLEVLTEQTVWTVRGRVCSIGQEGGVSQAVVDRCIDRMRSWVVLARAALSAEFPSWEMAQVGGRLPNQLGEVRRRHHSCLLCALPRVTGHVLPAGRLSRSSTSGRRCTATAPTTSHASPKLWIVWASAVPLRFPNEEISDKRPVAFLWLHARLVWVSVH